jgi:hypothetical protein
MAPVGNRSDGISTRRKNRATPKTAAQPQFFILSSTAAEQFQDDLQPSIAKTASAYRITDVRRAGAVTE